jgi:limonene-1,2-epoxide hydrolase
MNQPGDTSIEAERCKRLVLDFLATWRRRDLDHLMSFFDEHSVYHNVPVEPIQGVAPIRAVFTSFLDAFSFASLDVVTVAAEPGLVIAERIDRFEKRDGTAFELPVTGVFVVRGDRIERFSDYFDLATFERRSGMKL